MIKLMEIKEWDGDPSNLKPLVMGDLYVSPAHVMSVSAYIGHSSVQFITGFNVAVMGSPNDIAAKIFGAE